MSGVALAPLLHSCPAAVKLVNEWWKMAADVDTNGHAYTRFRTGSHIWWRHCDPDEVTASKSATL